MKKEQPYSKYLLEGFGFTNNTQLIKHRYDYIQMGQEANDVMSFKNNFVKAL